ncbi:YchJ family protein, partial [Streptomyces boncukensis]
PCGLPAGYGACCGRFHDGRATASTAELLMRSRYAAFAVGDEAYLLRTWHPRTRPTRVDVADGPEWTGLEIVEAVGGTAFHTEGQVAFRAYCTADGKRGTLEERSRFVRHEGEWVYLDAVT